MGDQKYKNTCVQKVKVSRAKLIINLRKLGFTVRDSYGNFVLATPTITAEDVYLPLKERGILVRYFNQPGLQDKLRITVGNDEQNQLLIAALETILNKQHP